MAISKLLACVSARRRVAYVFLVDGKVVAVISLSSTKYEARAYAIDAVRAADLIEEQRASGRLGPDVDITRCH